MRRLLSLVILLLGLAVPGSGRLAAADTIGFALLSSRPQAEAEAEWAPILVSLSQRLGVMVVAHWYPDYAGAIWGLRNGRDGLALLGNKSAIEAVDKAGAAVFASQSFGADLSGYQSLLIVGRTSRWTDVESLLAAGARLTVGMGDPNSTSGTVVPTHYLFHARQLEPRDVFRRVVPGSHPDNIIGVAEGRLDAATVSSVTFDHFLTDHADIAARVRIVWRSPFIPGSPLVWSKSLPEAYRAGIRRFFLEYGRLLPGKWPQTQAEEQVNLGKLEIASFVAADNTHLVPVRRLDLALARYRIERTLPEGEEQTRQLADIDRRLADIDRRLAENGFQ